MTFSFFSTVSKSSIGNVSIRKSLAFDEGNSLLVVSFDVTRGGASEIFDSVLNLPDAIKFETKVDDIVIDIR